MNLLDISAFIIALVSALLSIVSLLIVILNERNGEYKRYIERRKQHIEHMRQVQSNIEKARRD